MADGIEPRVPAPVRVGGAIASAAPLSDAAPAGSELRGARLSCGYTMDDVQEQLGIRAEYIDAIERGALSELPGKAFHVGYVSSYAEFVDTQKYFGRSSAWYVEQLCAHRFEEPEVEPSAGPETAKTERGMTAPAIGDPRFTGTLRWVLTGIATAVAVGILAGGWSLFRGVQRVEIVEAPSIEDFRVSE